MKKMIAALTISVLGLANVATAQTALEIAQAQDVCNGAQVLAAERLADGRLKVTCPQGSVTPESAAASGATVAQPAVLAGTGLSTGAVLGILGAVIVIVAVSGDSSDGTTTTTTTTTN